MTAGTFRCRLRVGLMMFAAGASLVTLANGQTKAPAPATSNRPATTASAAEPTRPPTAASAVVVPADYVIGPDDILSIVVWRDKDMSADVTVRPDGKITLLLINDIQAGGLAPEQLRVAITKAYEKFMEDPTIAVSVKQINSLKVFITGQVTKPGSYPLHTPTTVLQLLAQAGGVLEYADAENIQINRMEAGKPVSVRVNYKDLLRGKNLQQNVLLKPGDTVLVP